MYKLVKQELIDNQIGGKKYSQRDIDNIMTNSLQHVLKMYVKSNNEKQELNNLLIN